MNIPDLRRRADSGSAVAQAPLGVCYLDGIDVEVNYVEAFRLLSAAADRGATRAITNLARMHANGLGIPCRTQFGSTSRRRRRENSWRKSNLPEFTRGETMFPLIEKRH